MSATRSAFVLVKGVIMLPLFKLTVRDKTTNKVIQIHERYAGDLDSLVKEEFEKNPNIRISIVQI